MKSDVENLGPWGRDKISDFMSEPSDDRVRSAECQVVTCELAPLFSGEIQMAPEYRLSSDVIESGLFSKNTQVRRVSTLRGEGGLVDEDRARGGSSMLRPEKCD